MGDIGRRSGVDLQIPLVYRIGFQEVKTEFSIAFFLFGERKRHQNAGLGNAHCTFIADRPDAKIQNRQGIFDRCGTDSDTFYEPFRPVLGRQKRQTDLPKTHKKQK